MEIVSFLVWLLVAALVLYAVWYILGIFPVLPPNARTAVMLILAIIILLWFLSKIGLVSGFGVVD